MLQNNKEKMLSFIHKRYRNDLITNEILKGTGIILDEIEKDTLEIKEQNIIETATWGLDIFEKDLNINNRASPYEQRRELISAKLRGSGKLDLKLIKDTLDAYTNSDVDVKFTGIIEITFINILGKPPNIDDVYRTIEEIKPAHLGLKYVFIYRTHQELSKYTHDYLSQYSHNDLRSMKGV